MADVDLDVVDEFTDTPFECNPLAVVQGAEDPAGGVHERRRLRGAGLERAYPGAGLRPRPVLRPAARA